jgi:single-stranded-DNA-specific exonuclease
MQRQWIFPSMDGNEAVSRLSNEVSVPIFLARVLMRNGLGDFNAATSFLEPRLRQLQDPFLIPEMEAAVARIRRAIECREGIVLYGDYDVDGVASLALLQRILTAMGARVSCFLPLRAEDGYGLSPSGVERCFAQYSPELLIAVDCGTNSAREVAVIHQRGADVIVLDHHEVSSERPDCVALVNP